MNSNPHESIDLTTLALPDVLQLMVTSSGRSWETVANMVGWGPANVNRIRDAKDDYWPTLPKLARFCSACRSTLVLDWIGAQVEIGAVELEVAALDCVSLLDSLGDLFREMGEVAKAGGDAVHDDGDKGCHISQREARQIIRELVDVINRGMLMVSRLRPIAGKPGDRI
ncbi:phage regulatory CII family protein [Pseudodesulfovibrio tunisiensis]|uniref:phage regulatory CII family protein n=1 Tax=Pseudodesulfovibrio tunisiensis TaxID=463192 RepID=UPI001FB1E081|nr:phage regulatory CII family protein [Pseudodesulfovibrio tunisiensis]